MKPGTSLPTLGRIGSGLWQATLGRVWKGSAPTIKVVAGAGTATITDAAGRATLRDSAGTATITDPAGRATVRPIP